MRVCYLHASFFHKKNKYEIHFFFVKVLHFYQNELYNLSLGLILFMLQNGEVG